MKVVEDIKLVSLLLRVDLKVIVAEVRPKLVQIILSFNSSSRWWLHPLRSFGNGHLVSKLTDLKVQMQLDSPLPGDKRQEYFVQGILLNLLVPVALTVQLWHLR